MIEGFHAICDDDDDDDDTIRSASNHNGSLSYRGQIEIILVHSWLLSGNAQRNALKLLWVLEHKGI